MMQEVHFGKAAELASPNPLVLICTEKPDGTINLSPVSFVSFLSVAPFMLGFAMAKPSYSGERTRETGRCAVVVPGESLSEAVMHCGTVSGRDADKAARTGIRLAALPGNEFQVPADSRLAFVCKLEQTVDVGDHFLYICRIEKSYGDETKNGLHAWNGYAKAAPCKEK